MTYGILPGPGDWLPIDDDGPTCCGDPMVRHDEVEDMANQWDVPVPTHVLHWWCMECDRTYPEHPDY